ncbi:MAG: DUF1566 domain-containing protein, partial [Bacteroidaceae bacterium]|nr:DUF1566 domain-containing protein [Bacteroidaceae bacterium]
ELDKMSNYLKSQASGIVFWTTAETTTEGRTTPAKLTDDVIMATDFPNCTHGLIVSLTDASASCAWQGVLENNKTKNSEAVYENFQNTDFFTLANKDKYETIKADEEATGNVNKILGYQSTQVLRAYNKYCTETDGKAEYIVKAVTAIDQWALSNPAPANTTGWFLPSLKELHMLCYKDVDNIWGVEGTETKTFVNGLLEKVGGNQFGNEYYWPSLEYGTSQCISQDFQDGNHAWQAKGILNKVRAVCAF